VSFTLISLKKDWNLIASPPSKYPRKWISKAIERGGRATTKMEIRIDKAFSNEEVACNSAIKAAAEY